MLIASKYEEMYAPEIADFVYITDNAYSKADIRRMECLILKTLDFNLGRPLPLHFLRRNSKAGEVSYFVATVLFPYLIPVLHNFWSQWCDCLQPKPLEDV